MNQTNPEGRHDESGVRRYSAEKARSPRRTPLVNMSILIALIGIIVFVIWQFLFKKPVLFTDEFSLTQAIEEIEELATVRSHVRFAVVVREESGNLVVRQLADQVGKLDMDDIGSMLFQDPTLLAELHGVATYGIKLDDIEERIMMKEDTLYVALPSPELLDVKIVNADTRVIAQMKGLFRSENHELLLEASRHGEVYAREFAESDSASLELAASRAREVVALLAHQAGKETQFTEEHLREEP